MKVLKLLLVLCVSFFMVTACDDNDDALSGDGGTGVVPQVAVSFDNERMTVLKNAGEVQVPVVLADAAEGTVKLTVGVKEQTGNVANEGIDFEIKEKVISIEKGNKIGYVSLVLMDDGKTDTDKSFVIEIKSIYGYGKKAETKQSCEVAIVSNAFIEFQYKARETAEAAGKYRIPLLVTGKIKETTTLTLRVKEGGSALEGTHFKIANPQVVLEKDATSGELEIELTDDSEANSDRWFDLEIVDIKGSNAVVGTGTPVCRVTIVSEEVLKSVSFSAAEYSVEEGEELRIPIALDKAPISGEPDVVVTLTVKTANSGAIETTDFTIVEKTITFVAGQKEDEVVIRTNQNAMIKDLYFELAVKAAVGANVGTPDACKVIITNKDLPTFEKETYEVEEDAGALNIPITLPYTYAEDLLLKLEIIPSEGTEEGTHFTIASKEVNIPAGSQSANISLDIKHDLDWNDPSFKIIVKEVNETVLRYEAATTVKMTQCAYRTILGVWSFQCGNYDGNGLKEENHKTDVTLTVGEFNKTFICKGKWVHNWSEMSWSMSFNPATKAMTMITAKPVNTGAFAGEDIYLLFYNGSSWSDVQTPVPLTLDANHTTITLNAQQIGGYLYHTGTFEKDGRAWFFWKNNLKMVKK